MILSNITPIPRRTFFACGLAAGWAASRSFAESSAARSGAALPPVNSFSRLKKKLVDGQSATLLIISDSTGYRDDSGVRRFIRWLASQYPAQRASEWYWAEWVTNAPTGPRAYGEPIVISEGKTKAAFTILNAVLPGAFAQAMIDGSRWANMLAPLNRQAPDPRSLEPRPQSSGGPRAERFSLWARHFPGPARAGRARISKYPPGGHHSESVAGYRWLRAGPRLVGLGGGDNACLDAH